MANSYVEYTSVAGGTTNLNVPFPYLDPEQVELYIDDVLQTKVTAWDFTSPTNIALVTPTSGGEDILIQRKTEIDSAAVTFSNAMLVDTDLNTSHLQNFYLHQEVVDGLAIGTFPVLGSALTSGAATDGYVLTADGSGAVAWEAPTAVAGLNDVVDDTTPQLGGDLDLNSSDITGDGSLLITSAAAASRGVEITTSNAAGVSYMGITNTESATYWQFAAYGSGGLYPDKHEMYFSSFGGDFILNSDYSTLWTISDPAGTSTWTVNVDTVNINGNLDMSAYDIIGLDDLTMDGTFTLEDPLNADALVLQGDGTDFSMTFTGSVTDLNIGSGLTGEVRFERPIEVIGASDRIQAGFGNNSFAAIDFGSSTDADHIVGIYGGSGDMVGFHAYANDGVRNGRAFFGIHDNDRFGISATGSTIPDTFALEFGGDPALEIVRVGAADYDADLNGSLTINHSSTTFTDPGLHLVTDAPTIMFEDSGAAADNQIWTLGYASEAFRLRAWDDALSGSQDALVVSRTANVIDDVTLYADNTGQLRTQDNDASGSTTGGQVKDHAADYYDIGLNVLPARSFNGSLTLAAENCGKITGKTDAGAETLTLPGSGDVDFPVYGVVTVVNMNSSGNYTINASTNSATLYWADGSTRTGGSGTNRTIGPGGVATIWRVSTTTWHMWGTGIS